MTLRTATAGTEARRTDSPSPTSSRTAHVERQPEADQLHLHPASGPANHTFREQTSTGWNHVDPDALGRLPGLLARLRQGLPSTERGEPADVLDTDRDDQIEVIRLSPVGDNLARQGGGSDQRRRDAAPRLGNLAKGAELLRRQRAHGRLRNRSRISRAASAARGDVAQSISA